jgi:uncharacterized protein (DUF2252 family)
VDQPGPGARRPAPIATRLSPISPGHASPKERADRGRAARANARRSTHAAWEAPPDRPDPIDLLEAQAAGRVPELIPIRYGRMMTSPFAFLRGAACVMASDLARTPVSGLRAQVCGDAHLSNFGRFASPERALVFDLDDFDETLPGPWEWDLKRLVTSLEVAGRDRNFGPKTRRRTLLAAGGSYRKAIRAFGRMTNLELWYSGLDAGPGPGGHRAIGRYVPPARPKHALARLTHEVDGELRFVSDPPLIVPVDELLPSEAADRHEAMRGLLESYAASLDDARRRLLERYRYADLARKVVGVGSVGTRCWVVLMLGRDVEDPLILQVKEARPSVLEPFAGASRFENSGRRVVEGQRLMQASGDIFLGWLHSDDQLDGGPRDYYVRQLWDWKDSTDVAGLGPKRMLVYARTCAWTLARAHARSGDAIAIGAYAGGGGKLDRAVAGFAERYADQNERDHRALVDAVRTGRIAAAEGV